VSVFRGKKAQGEGVVIRKAGAVEADTDFTLDVC